MTIRYQCPECDSVLKIKDELAGTDGKCPKCKSKFIVPEPDPDAQEKSAKSKVPAEKSQTEKAKNAASAKAAASKEAPQKKSEKKGKEASSKKSSKAAPAAKKADDDDFDPADFLMEDGPGPKASAGLTAPTEEKPKGPAVDSQGRRLYTGGGAGSKARAASMSPAAAAAAAAADGQSTSSANARDLLSKSADESRVKASAMPMKEKTPIFDFAGAGKELVRYAPHTIGAIVGIFVLYWGMNKMMGGGIELPELGPVSGTVTVNGDPLVGVTVNFSPLDDVRAKGSDGPDRIRTSSGVTDENGYYTLYYLGDTKGAAVGKGRLWLEIRSAADLKKVPPEWSSPGPNIREVKATGNNNDGEFNIAIKKTPPQS